jgi:uncharacterized protein YjbI with pentapeptide repeats
VNSADLGNTGRFDEHLAIARSSLYDRSGAARSMSLMRIAELADEHDDHRQACIDQLCGYLREPYPAEPDTSGWRDEMKVRHGAIRTVGSHLRDRASAGWHGYDFDFTGVTFDGGDLRDAQFTGGRVAFDRADFSSSVVSFAGADFCGAAVTFTATRFSGAFVDFTGARFSGGSVSFTGAGFAAGTVCFAGADFSGARVVFDSARFCGADVHLDGAYFSGGTVDLTTAETSTQPPRLGAWADIRPPGLLLPPGTAPGPAT